MPTILHLRSAISCRAMTLKALITKRQVAQITVDTEKSWAIVGDATPDATLSNSGSTYEGEQLLQDTVVEMLWRGFARKSHSDSIRLLLQSFSHSPAPRAPNLACTRLIKDPCGQSQSSWTGQLLSSSTINPRILLLVCSLYSAQLAFCSPLH